VSNGRGPSALGQAHALIVLASISTAGTLINGSWYDEFRSDGISHNALDQALDRLAAGGKITIEAGEYGVSARRIVKPGVV
jgi:hypothetical protein